MATEIVVAGSRLDNDIRTVNLSPEIITESEARLHINNATEEDDSQIMQSSKLYSQFVQPEQDLLLFSSAELLNIVTSFGAAK